MPTNINFNKKLGIIKGTNIILPSSSPPTYDNEYSFLFDGMTDYVDMSNPSNLNFDADDAFSISVWFKRQSDINAFGIVAKALGAPDYNGYILFVYNNQIYFRIRRNASLSHQIISNDTHPFNVWVHYVVTYDGSRSGSGLGLNLYQDGIKLTNVQKSGNFSTGSAQTSADFSIGSRQPTSDLYFEGNIDEVSVFSSELSASDVTSIFNLGVPASLTSLNPLGWWRMGEEASYTGGQWTLTDQGSGGNDGTSATLPAPPTQPSTDVPLWNNKSFVFDGIVDYIDMNTTIVGTTFSISAWFKVANTTDLQPIVSTRENSISSSKGIDIYIQSDILTFRIYRNGGTSVTQAFTDLGWNHVLYVYDGTTLEGFLNGVSIGSAIGTYATSTQTLKTGIFLPSSAYAETNIDEVALFYTDESANASTIYNSGVPASLTSYSPVGWWRMGEDATFDGTNWTLPDNGSGGNDGDSVSMPLASRTSDVPT